MSRLKNTSKNVAASMGNRLAASIASTLSQVVFVRILGDTYLGINSLFGEIISVLALTELGLEAAVTFYLYKPLAEKDMEKLKSIMFFYRKAYQITALLVTAIGLGLIPFLPVMMKGTEGIAHIVPVYLIFLFNTVFSYFFSYKITFMIADQKQYWYTNILTVFDSVLACAQCLLILFTRNYYMYLLGNATVNAAKFLYISYWANKKYPFLQEEAKPLDRAEVRGIFGKMKGIIFFKFSDTCIRQTDSIITSAVISVQMVGKIANYNMFIKVISGVANSVMTAAVASIGNVLVTEKTEDKLRIFKTFDFLGGWFCGWCSICLFFLMTPAVELLYGGQYVLPQYVIFLVCMNFYLSTSRGPVGQVKIAAGLYESDRWIPVISAVLNIMISVYAAGRWGIIGIYMGTMISNLVLQISFPIVVYKGVFERSPWNYFRDMIRNLLNTLGSGLVVYVLSEAAPISSLWGTIFYRCFLCIIVANVFLLAVNCRRRELKECMALAKRLVCAKKGREREEGQ
ncbi:MAG: lipopolysaccharide biosynthesis protein [Kineothrix sp.]